MKVITFFISLLVPLIASKALASQVVAECENPKGHAYYLETGLVKSGQGGWREDAISNSSILLTKEEKTYDIMYKDNRKQTISSIADGAKIILIRSSADEALFFVMYPGSTAEVYHFFRESNGKLYYATYQNRGGPGTPISKNSLMVGTCDQIEFNSITPH